MAAGGAGAGDDDHYRTLGLRRGSSKAEVKSAFHRLAKTHHPDRHQHADAAAQEANAAIFRQARDAYDVLHDDDRRAEYDRRSSSSTAGSASGGYRRHGYGRSGGASSSSYSYTAGSASSSGGGGGGASSDSTEDYEGLWEAFTTVGAIVFSVLACTGEIIAKRREMKREQAEMQKEQAANCEMQKENAANCEAANCEEKEAPNDERATVKKESVRQWNWMEVAKDGLVMIHHLYEFKKAMDELRKEFWKEKS